MMKFKERRLDTKNLIINLDQGMPVLAMVLVVSMVVLHPWILKTDWLMQPAAGRGEKYSSLILYTGRKLGTVEYPWKSYFR